MRGVHLLSLARESAPMALARRLRERRRRVPWPLGAAASPRGDRLAIVIVNYSTRELVSQLLFSLHRVLGRDQFAEIVVVDNGSEDGSLEVLQALADAGLIHLLANRRQRYHGAGLNQAVSWLAERQAGAPPESRVDYVWALDSDTLVLRRDAARDAVVALRGRGAAVIGESFGQRDGYEHLALFSLLFDPRVVWRDPLAPFSDDGAPEKRLLESVADAGAALEAFPFAHHSYVLHLGSGTLMEVAHGRRSNRFYGWAQRHSDQHDFTYTGHPLGRRLRAAVVEAYRAETGDGTPRELVAACRREELIVIPEARPLPPREDLQRMFEQGVDVTAALLEDADG